nr:MAG TPA: hypothetical protein [Caudoviricetes sp.]
MLNQSGITKSSGLTRKTILFDTKLFFALPCMISNSGVEAGSDGKKVVKAGTPLVGSLVDRDTAFTVGAKDGAVVGIAEHDVDVTAGTANGGIIIFGFIDEDKLDASVVALLDTANTDSSKLRDKLTNITFCK